MPVEKSHPLTAQSARLLSLKPYIAGLGVLLWTIALNDALFVSPNPQVLGRYSLAKLLSIVLWASIGSGLVGWADAIAQGLERWPPILHLRVGWRQQLLSVGRWSFLPEALFLFCLTTLFTVTLLYPFFPAIDFALQFKFVQMFLQGQVAGFNWITQVNLQDLAQNRQEWMLWWPIGLRLLILPPLAIGIPVGLLTRSLAYLLPLLAGLGWLKVAATIGVSSLTRCLLAVLWVVQSLSYFWTVGGTDLFTNALLPWLFLYTFSSLRSGSVWRIWLASFLMGMIYWLKYSAMFAAIGLMAYLCVVCWSSFQPSPESKLPRLRWQILGIALCCFALPIVGLSLLNLHASGMAIATQQMQSQTATLIEITRFGGANASALAQSVQGWQLVYSMFGAPGIALATPIVYNLAHWLIVPPSPLADLFWAIGLNPAILVIPLVGSVGTVLLGAVLLSARRFVAHHWLLLAWLLLVIPVLGAAYASRKVGLNFLITDFGRYATGFMPFLWIFVCAGGIYHLQTSYSQWSRGVKFLLIVTGLIFCLVPPYLDLKNFVWQARQNLALIPTAKTSQWLYLPTLSRRHPQKILDQIHSLMTSSHDVVLTDLQSPLELYALELALPFRTRSIEINSLLARQQSIQTSQPLRVVVVLNKALQPDQLSAPSSQVFPQAQVWRSLPPAPDQGVVIWYTDLLENHQKFGQSLSWADTQPH